MPAAVSKLQDFRDGRAKRKRARARKRRLRGYLNRERKRKLGKAVLVAALLAVLALLALAVGDADYHATVVGWAPLVAAVFLIVLAFFYAKALARALDVAENPRLEDCRRGQATPYNIHFENHSPLVFFKVEATFFISDLFGNVASEATTTIGLGPFESYDLSFSARFDHIGTYSAGLSRVVVTDFLGLFSKNVYQRSHHSVEVIPNIQMLEKVTFDDTATVETSKAAKSVLADSMDYAQVREYVPGDPLKTIHWKLSARAQEGTYYTRLYEVYNEPGVAVIMDFSAPHEEAEVLMSILDAVVESAFSIAEYAKRKGMDTEVLYKNRYGEEQRVLTWNDDSFPEIVASFPRMSNDPAAAEDAAEVLRGQIMSRYGQSTLVVCTGNLQSEVVSGLVDAKARRRSPFMVAIVPPGIDGRARDAYVKPLAQLDAANIPYVVISSSDELAVSVS